MEEKKFSNLKGIVDTIIYKNETNGFTVLVLDADGEPVTVVGEIGNVEEEEELNLTGEYIEHPKFGPQFKAQLCEAVLPSSVTAIRKYLDSGVIKGVGPVLSKRIVEKFGEDTFEIFENFPERLREVEGITANKANKIVENFNNVFGIRNLMGFMAKHSISQSFGIKAWRMLGKGAIENISENPYVLCGYGIELPFEKAEQIAEELQIPRESKNRLKSGISYVLMENSYSGHTCLPEDRLCEICCRLLEIDLDLYNEILEEEIENQNLIRYTKNDRNYIYLREYFLAEDFIKKRMQYMKQSLYNNNIDFDEVIKINEKENDIVYEKTQKEAISIALSNGFMILTGGPGTGKTTTLNAIISLYEQQGLRVAITAPTGRAAKRVSDLTGYEAKTIHRLLDIQPSDGDKFNFVHDDMNLLDYDAIIIDEMSMVDVLLFESFLKAMPLSCNLIMVGDSDQLPSVGAGNLLKDLIESEIVPCVKLNQIFRQAKESAIVTNAHLINKGEMIDLSSKDKDFFFLQRLDFESVSKTVIELQKDRLPNKYLYDSVNDIQVLCPTRKGPVGVIELNKSLQQALNPVNKNFAEVKTVNYIFRVNDKVMQMKNNYDIKWQKDGEKGSGIFNGDIGIIKGIDKSSENITIDFDGRVCHYNYAMLENLDLAYATTVHKSQGSEFEVVILPLLGGYDKLYFRNLFYTAVTRAKKMLIIVGSSKRVKFMIDNDKRTYRYTCLKSMLMEDN